MLISTLETKGINNGIVQGTNGVPRQALGYSGRERGMSTEWFKEWCQERDQEEDDQREWERAIWAEWRNEAKESKP